MSPSFKPLSQLKVFILFPFAPTHLSDFCYTSFVKRAIIIHLIVALLVYIFIFSVFDVYSHYQKKHKIETSFVIYYVPFTTFSVSGFMFVIPKYVLFPYSILLSFHILNILLHTLQTFSEYLYVLQPQTLYISLCTIRYFLYRLLIPDNAGFSMNTPGQNYPNGIRDTLKI